MLLNTVGIRSYLVSVRGALILDDCEPTRLDATYPGRGFHDWPGVGNGTCAVHGHRGLFQAADGPAVRPFGQAARVRAQYRHFRTRPAKGHAHLLADRRRNGAGVLRRSRIPRPLRRGTEPGTSPAPGNKTAHGHPHWARLSRGGH